MTLAVTGGTLRGRRLRPPRDRAVERLWLLGSAAGMGVVDRLLSLEANHHGQVLERLLEFGFDGVYRFDSSRGSRMIHLSGVTDRIDLLEGGRLRVIDYKSGRAPSRAQALQLPVYGRCAEQRLDGRHGTSWQVGGPPMLRSVSRGLGCG